MVRITESDLTVNIYELIGFPVLSKMNVSGGVTMKEEEKLRQLYEDMYAAMICKDEAALMRMHESSFVLVHMTGLHQDRDTYIHAVMDGTLNYYSARTKDLSVHVHGDSAVMTGRSLISAAVFGSGRHTWRLQLCIQAQKRENVWKLMKAEASAW